MSLELAPLLGEMPSLMPLEPVSKAFGVPRFGFDSRLLALLSLEQAHPESANKDFAVAALIKTVVEIGRRKVLLSFGAPGKRAKGHAAQSKEQNARKKPSMQCCSPFCLEASAATDLS